MSEQLRRALEIAEAALADIGDADREPGDDVAWCEARAAQALPDVRAALSTHHAAPEAPQQEASGDWSIDRSCGRPILVYQGCSVIEAEQAEYVLGLIRAAATAPAGGVTDEQIMDAAKPHFKPDADITPKTKAAYIASVRAVLALTTAARAAEPELRHVGWMVPINSKNHYIDGVWDPSDVLTDVQLPKLRKVFAASPQPPTGTEKKDAEPVVHQGMTIAGDGAAMLGRLMREQRASRLGVYPDGNPNAGTEKP